LKEPIPTNWQFRQRRRWRAKYARTRPSSSTGWHCCAM
jgi:hypothetical protein